MLFQYDVVADSEIDNNLLLDPRTRDEDISHTKISVSYQQLPNGLFEYFYDIESPLENKGTIMGFLMDISCDDDFGTVDFGESPSNAFWVHKNAKIVPVQADGVMHYSIGVSVTARSEMYWPMILRPANTAKGFRLVSPAKPALVNYWVEPKFDTLDWDYDSYDEDDPTVPGIPEFTVSGLIIGPACPSKPIELFSGSNKHALEPDNINQLLSYAAPLLDRFHVKKNTQDFEMTVYYSPEIDVKSFKVEPANLKKYFDPKPGTNQRLFLPLKNNKNKTKIKLSAKSILSSIKGKKDYAPGKMTDYDEFEIRVD